MRTRAGLRLSKNSCNPSPFPTLLSLIAGCKDTTFFLNYQISPFQLTQKSTPIWRFASNLLPLGISLKSLSFGCLAREGYTMSNRGQRPRNHGLSPSMPCLAPPAPERSEEGSTGITIQAKQGDVLYQPRACPRLLKSIGFQPTP